MSLSLVGGAAASKALEMKRPNKTIVLDIARIKQGIQLEIAAAAI
jgi:hypothetical protein